MHDVHRRLLTILLPVAAASLVAGCATFDTDTIVSIGDEKLDRDGFDQLVADAGLPAEVTPSGDEARQLLNNWIAQTATDAGLISAELVAGLGDSQLAPVYSRGLAASGIVCLKIIVTESVDTADSAASRLADGESFDDVFTEANIDPTLAETVGDIGCVPQDQLPPPEPSTPIADALYALDTNNRVETAEAENADGSIGGLLVFFSALDELQDQDAVAVLEGVRASSGVRILVEDLDISVDPRFGVFDLETASVIALG